MTLDSLRNKFVMSGRSESGGMIRLLIASTFKAPPRQEWILSVSHLNPLQSETLLAGMTLHSG